MLDIMNTNVPSEPAKSKNKMIGIGVVGVIAIVAAVLIYQFFASTFSFPLEGKWLYGNSGGSYSTTHTVVFKSDGTFQEARDNNSDMGTYTVLKKGAEGKLQIKVNSEVSEYDYAVKGDLATLTKITSSGQGTNIQLKKAP